MGTLILMRHAKSDWPAGVDDLQRPLADRGERDAVAAGAALAELGAPELVLCSPARRTRETWQIVAGELGAQAPVLQVSPGIYGADDDELLDIVRAVPADVASVLVLGHNPTMQSTARALAGSGSDAGALDSVRGAFPTAALAVLAVDGAWADLTPGTTRLQRFLVPRA